MAELTRTLQSLGLALLATAAFAACSDDGTPDTGGMDAGSTDTGPNPDAMAAPDTGPRDAGMLDAQPTPDAARYCTSNEQVDVDGTNVQVGETSMETQANGMRPIILCTNPVEATFNDPIFIRGCVDVIGAAPTPADLDTLDISLFRAFDDTMMPVDPTFDPATGADRSPAEKLELDVTFDTTVPVSNCESQIQVDIGFNANPLGAIQTEVPYIVRVRTASTSTATFATQYFFGVVGRNDNITNIGGGDCNSQRCFHRFNMTLVRSAALAGFIGQATTAVPGSSNLRDGQGAGYAMIEIADCAERPMQYAVAGFDPPPLNDGYLTGATLDLAATESSADALYFAMGFPGMAPANTMGREVTGAVGADRDGTCTEEYAGRKMTVYPDAISVMRTSRENSLRAR